MPCLTAIRQRPHGRRVQRRLRDGLRAASGWPSSWAPTEPLSGSLLPLLADGHVLVEDVPGRARRSSHGRRPSAGPRHGPGSQGTARSCCRPTSPARAFSRGRHPPVFACRGPLFTNVLLVDESQPGDAAVPVGAPRGHSRSARSTIEGTTRPLPDPFVVLATQNPIEFEGRSPCPRPSWTASSASGSAPIRTRLPSGSIAHRSPDRRRAARTRSSRSRRRIAPIALRDEVRRIRRPRGRGVRRRGRPGDAAIPISSSARAPGRPGPGPARRSRPPLLGWPRSSCRRCQGDRPAVLAHGSSSISRR